MIDATTLTAAGWKQGEGKYLSHFWGKGILAYEDDTGDVIYTGREPYLVVATGVRDITELAALSSWRPPVRKPGL